MDSSDTSITACRLCQHYNPEGRRNGFCEKLDVPVSPTWEACRLAAHPFEASWNASHDFNALFHDSLEIMTSDHHPEIQEMQEVVMRSLSLSEH